MGTKRQKNDYTELDYEKQWKTYKRNLRVNARMHHCENVLDPAYVPAGADEAAVLKDNNKFMFAVFLSTLNTDHGKTLIRKHEDTGDAQALWADLVLHMMNSTDAAIRAAQMLKYIANGSMAKGWKGSKRGYILHWLEQLRSWEELVEDDLHFGDKLKMMMLSNTVSEVSDLGRVQLSNLETIARGGKSLGFQAYQGLLIAAAELHDKNTGLGSHSRSRRILSQHEITDDPDSEDEGEESEDDSEEGSESTEE